MQIALVFYEISLEDRFINLIKEEMCRNQKNRKMQETVNSDLDLTMLATKSFHHIINEVQTSCLNYQFQISPFSAVISLKKSLLRDISGKALLPTKLKYDTFNENIEALVARNQSPQNMLTFLGSKFHLSRLSSFQCDSSYKIYQMNTRYIRKDALIWN